MRLSIEPSRLKVAMAATKLGPDVFGLIETIVAANQEEIRQRRLGQLVGALREALDDILSSESDPLAPMDEGTSRREVLAAQIQAELEATRLREKLLAESIGVEEAAQFTQRSRQALERRRREGRLLALKMKNQWRYPKWQFDPASPGGVVPGLEEVLGHLELSPAGAAAWMTEPSDVFGGKSAIELLRKGRARDVIELAEEYGHLP